MLFPRLSSSLPAAVLLASTAFAPLVSAQTSTSCQPLNTTNCPADPALGTDYQVTFNSTPSSDLWETTAGSVDYSSDNGATFTINKQGDSPTIRTKFYIFFGRTELWIKSAPGQGIVSSVMMLSDDLDEIDLEWIGGNDSIVSTNFFGKGILDYTKSATFAVTDGPQGDFHNYTTVWTNSSLQWWIDGKMVRQLLPAEANKTYNYPQTPMRLSLGIWAGGDPRGDNGTIQWAGGVSDFSKGPYSMHVKSAQITDYSTGSEYSYGDMTGSASSIKIAAGNSTALKAISNESTSQSMSDKWNNLSSGAKAGIFAGVGVAAGGLLLWGIISCIRQRRRGAMQARIALQKAEAERLELENMKKAGINPDALNNAAVDYQSGGAKSSSTWEKSSLGNVGAAGAGTGLGVSLNGGTRSPISPLHNGPQTPRMVSPGFEQDAYYQGGIRREPSFASTVSPQPSPSSNFGGGGLMNPPQQRSVTNVGLESPVLHAGPGPASRGGSPGPGPGGYGGIQRMQSPAPILSPQPQQPIRNFTGGSRGGGDATWGGNGAYR